MKINRVRLRQLHRALVPFMIGPLLLTLMTGMCFQFAVVSDRTSDFLWLLELHRIGFANAGDYGGNYVVSISQS